MLIISKSWNKQGMRTTQRGKNKRLKHRRREGSTNKDTISSRKLTTEFFDFFRSKITDTEMKKKVKKKYAKEIKNKREREEQ